LIENFAVTTSESDFVEPSSQELSSAASEITDTALSEIGRRIEQVESEEKGNRLALANNEPTNERGEDFMKQKLNSLLTSGETNYSDQTELEAEDHFDTDVVLATNATHSDNENGGNREVTFTASFALTKEQTAREQSRASRKNELENDFYNALTAGVL